MSTLILPRRFGQQPQQVPQIDYANPITKNLVFAAIPQGATLADVLTGYRGALTGAGAPTPAVGVGGRNLLFNGGTATNSYVDFSTNLATKNLSSGASTWFFWASATGQGGFAEKNDNNSSAGWIVGCDQNTNLGFIRVNSGADTRVSSNTAIPSGFTSLAVTYDGGLAGSGVSMYIGGQTSATTIRSNGSGAAGDDSAQSLYLGRAQFGYSGSTMLGSLPGNIEFAAFFSRILSASEILSLHNRRYQIFDAPQRRLWVVAAATAVNVNLAGNAATGSVGTISVGTTVTGNVATGSMGSVTAEHDVALVGNAATGSVGTISVGTTVTGNAATGAVGTISVGTTVTGNAATGSPGTLTPNLLLGLSGNVATGGVGTTSIGTTTIGNAAVGSPGSLVAEIDAVETGNAAAGSPGTLSPTLAFTLAGNAATTTPGTLTPNLLLSLTGNAATGSPGTLTTTSGLTLTLVGNAATGSPGTFTTTSAFNLVGNAATSSTGTVSAAEALTGNAAAGLPGAVVAGVSVGLVGNAAVGGTGNITNATTVLGNATAGGVGTVGVSVSISLTGNAAVGGAGVMTVLRLGGATVFPRTATSQRFLRLAAGDAFTRTTGQRRFIQSGVQQAAVRTDSDDRSLRGASQVCIFTRSD
jgi:hypothetical protein